MNKNILKLAIPNILSNISIPLLSTVDVALMGHLSILHLGAIGLGTMIFNFLFWNFGFLRMGTTGLVAQAHGAKNEKKLQDLLSKGVYLSVLIALFLLILKAPLGILAAKALAVSNDHLDIVWQYFNIRIWSAPATLLTYTLFGWFFGVQNSVVPMVATILTNLVNILLSYILVVHLDWGIGGVATGTVIAEYVGLFLLIYILKMKHEVRLTKLTQLTEWQSFLSINNDLFIRTVALTGSFLFFYRQSTLSGELILATNVVLLQFLSWMSYGIDGFAYASESLVGKYLGSNERENLLKVVKLSFVWGFLLALLFSLSYGLFGPDIAELFTSDPLILTLMDDYLMWLWVLPIIAFVCYIWDGIFIGLTNTKTMRNTMILSFIVYIGVYSLTKDMIQNAIWVAFALFLLIRGIFLTICWFKMQGKLS